MAKAFSSWWTTCIDESLDVAQHHGQFVMSNRRLTAFLKAGELLVDARLCFHASFKSLMMAVFCYDRCLNSWLPEVLAA